MKIKLKLQLKPGEVVALSKHLAGVLGSQQMDELRKEPIDMLIMSALYELYAKVKEIAENIRLFPTRRTDDVYQVTISRTQAIAMLFVETEAPQATTAMQSYEANFLQGLIGTIYQTFLV